MRRSFATRKTSRQEQGRGGACIGLKDDSLFALAGLWETWKDKANGESLETYTVITTDPNGLMAALHDRMRVILHPKDYVRWLAPADPSQLPVDLLRPYEADEMKAWKVSAAVGNVRRDTGGLEEL
ncbi:MAG: SOS response-associated peptidase family protein [Terracidiphilus sp.]